MKTNGIKSLVLAMAVLMAMIGSAQALTLNANDTLSATLESSVGFDSFTVYWGLDSWEGDLNMTIYDNSDPDIRYEAVDIFNPFESSDEWIYGDNFRSDFLAGSYGVPYFIGDTLTLEFAVTSGQYNFKNNAYSADSGIEENGPIVASYYTTPVTGEPLERWSNKGFEEDTIYSYITETEEGFTAHPTPEPTTWVLLAIGLVGLMAVRKKQTVR